MCELTLIRRSSSGLRYLSITCVSLPCIGLDLIVMTSAWLFCSHRPWRELIYGPPKQRILTGTPFLQVLLLGFPIQFVLVRIMFRARQAGVQLTDQRVRLTTEVLQGIRLIKFCAWEAFYANRIGALREKEVTKIRHIARVSAFESDLGRH